jgi:polysaccharide deacetylase family protein (PEP-CTERM system associated)
MHTDPVLKLGDTWLRSVAETSDSDLRPETTCNALTVDVEDYFHVEAFARTIDRQDWDHFPSRVVQNTNRLLDVFGEAGVVGTFFTLGWVARRYPELVRRITAEGHELASHGSQHQRADEQLPEEFRDDVRQSKALLEDISGVRILGYRAPTFSVGRRAPWTHAILVEEGFRYSSSVYPVAHDLYGEPGAPRTPFCPQHGFQELPLTTVRILGRNFPSSGGGYFRLLPYPLSRWALRQARRELGSPCIFYIHPWEIDPGQPRQVNASLRSRVRHYLNLGRTEERLCRLLRDFAWTRMDMAFGVEDMPPPPLLETWLTSPAR